MKMKLGISSYTLTWAVGVQGYFPERRLDEIGLLKATKNLEVNLLQIADNMPLHKMSEEQITNLIKKAKQYNIEIEVGANNMTPENLDKYIIIAERFQSRVLRFAFDGDGYKPSVEEVIPIIKNVLSELKSRNITLAIENHDRLTAADFIKIIDTVGSPNIGICLDCANSLGNGEGLHEVVRQLAPFTVNFHLKEVSIKRKYHKMGFDIEGKPFGEGCLPLEWMLDQLPSTCKTAILEQWTPPENTIQESIIKEYDWAQRSVNYLKNYFEA
jgi:sugar phosphate isomerase/epimerase